MQRASLSQENGRHRHCWVPSKSLLLSQNALEEGKRKAWGFRFGHRCGSATVRGSHLLTGLFLPAHRAWLIFQCTARAGTRLTSQSSCGILSVCGLTPTYLVSSSPLWILQGKHRVGPRTMPFDKALTDPAYTLCGRDVSLVRGSLHALPPGFGLPTLSTCHSLPQRYPPG